MTFKLEIPNIKTYQRDRRKPIEKIYQSFLKLDSKIWNMQVYDYHVFKIRNKEFKIPVLCFTTKKQGKALWLITGIHGEEPAGPNAFYENVYFINELAKKIPIVLFPLCNPSGYVRDWRYPNRRRRPRGKVTSVLETSEYFLLNLEDETKPREEIPSGKKPAALTLQAIKLYKKYPPVLSLDFHEDESLTKSYIYSQGKLGSNDPIAKQVVKILIRNGFKLKMSGKTGFNQKIKNGVVEIVHDDSLDELISSKKIIIKGKQVDGPDAKSVIVIETNTVNIPIEKRVAAHEEILLSSEKFFNMAKKI